jgi:hypothetical protein
MVSQERQSFLFFGISYDTISKTWATPPTTLFNWAITISSKFNLPECDRPMKKQCVWWPTFYWVSHRIWRAPVHQYTPIACRTLQSTCQTFGVRISRLARGTPSPQAPGRGGAAWRRRTRVASTHAEAEATPRGPVSLSGCSAEVLTSKSDSPFVSERLTVERDWLYKVRSRLTHRYRGFPIFSLLFKTLCQCEPLFR